jgi:hypothetical protein
MRSNGGEHYRLPNQALGLMGGLCKWYTSISFVITPYGHDHFALDSRLATVVSETAVPERPAVDIYSVPGLFRFPV